MSKGLQCSLPQIDNVHHVVQPCNDSGCYQPLRHSSQGEESIILSYNDIQDCDSTSTGTMMQSLAFVNGRLASYCMPAANVTDGMEQ